MSDQLKKVTARWHTALDVECPHCERYFDLEGCPDAFEWIYPIETKVNVDQEVKCPSCTGYFVVDRIARE
jgi:phage FluMu protein Com